MTWYVESGITALGSGSQTLGSGSSQINRNQGSKLSELLNGATESAGVRDQNKIAFGIRDQNFWPKNGIMSEKNVPCHDPENEAQFNADGLYTYLIEVKQ